jgi:DNA-directed RNA polymerase subunit omega
VPPRPLLVGDAGVHPAWGVRVRHASVGFVISPTLYNHRYTAWRCTTLVLQPGKASETVISPRIDRLLEQVDSNYAGVIVAAKRARQINSYYHNLGEGTFDEFPPPMVETGSKNYLTIALEEVAAGKMKYHYR